MPTLSDKHRPRPMSAWQVTRNHPVLSVLSVVLFLSLVLVFVLPGRYIVLNLSPSLAPGFYVATSAAPNVGRLVEFRLPEAIQEAHSDCTFYIRGNAPILKPIAAVPGDRVDTTGTVLRVNGIALAPIQTLDCRGQPLPVWRANRTLREDEFFVFSPRVWNSFDSRYFGPIRRSDIMSVRVPLLTW